MLGITVIDEGRDLKAMRCGPDDIAGRESGRQLPGQLGRFAGIARIAPIGMPALADIEFERDPELLTGSDGGNLADQASFDIVRGYGVAGERESRRRGKQQGEK